MEANDPYPQNFLASLDIIVHPITLGVVGGIVAIIVLLMASALISGAEVAFFSLSPQDTNRLEHKNSRNNRTVIRLLGVPEQLLATILITNNFVNIGIVIISTFVTHAIFDFSLSPVIGFIVEVGVITFLLLLFGEILPKVYASQYALKFSTFMAYPIDLFERLFRPLSFILVKSTSIVNRRFQRKQNISIDDLSDAIDLTEGAIGEEKNMLMGIVKFSNRVVTEIMCARVDVFAIDEEIPFNDLVEEIIDSGYSRIPVFSESPDNIKGVLFIKDLLPYLDSSKSFVWQKLIRKAYFVPETKKINDLLEDFRKNRTHMALVVDEYGGLTGLATMEDILEEIVGDIKDETDQNDEIDYKKIDDNTYIFDGKTLINDFSKVLDINDRIFEEVRGEAETLAGLILELKEEIPEQGSIISIKQFDFKVEEVDKRRIRSIRITVKDLS